MYLQNLDCRHNSVASTTGTATANLRFHVFGRSLHFHWVTKGVTDLKCETQKPKQVRKKVYVSISPIKNVTVPEPESGNIMREAIPLPYKHPGQNGLVVCTNHF